MSILLRMKAWLAQVNETSWHYKLVEEMSYTPQKACTYFWICLPMAILKAVILVGVVLFFGIGGWFLGFTVKIKTKPGDKALFFPYKRTSTGKRKKIVPWEVAIAGAVLFVSYSATSFVVTKFELVLQLFFLATALALMLVLLGGPIAAGIYFIVRNTKPVARIKKLWATLCPDLVVMRD